LDFCLSFLIKTQQLVLKKCLAAHEEDILLREMFFKNRHLKILLKAEPEVEDADYYDLNDHSHTDVTQEDIDKILDKISQSGYKNLTEREKKILFEASRKM